MRSRSFCQWVTTMMVIIAVIFPLPVVAFTDADAMNESGRLRMLSQRIAKTWLMLGMEIDVKKAERQLDESLTLFEKNISYLQDYAFTPEMKKAVNNVSDIWQQYRVDILNTTGRKQAQAILSASDKLLQASEALAQEIEQSNNMHSAKIVNLSGRQRMLSQRIAKIYLAEAWRVEGVSLGEEMGKAIEEFDHALQFLKSSSINTPVIAGKLKKVENQWKFSRTGFELNKNDQYVPTIISVTTESILKKMDSITGDYAQVMKTQGI